jgi:D-sedoheptulose 7-phosphate isomerase
MSESAGNDQGSAQVSKGLAGITKAMDDHVNMMDQLKSQFGDIEQAAKLIIDALKGGGKVLLCGNGGSAADAQHIAAEIIGRFEVERAAFPAIALTTDTSILTAVGNDYGFDQIFSRQVAGLGRAGDVLMAYSTSGNSANVLAAVEVARDLGVKVVSLTGQAGGALKNQSDLWLGAPSGVTARVQEAHGFIGHVICQLIDAALVDLERP